jgi:hypothetical protein
MKRVICGILAAGVLLLGGTSPGYAWGHGGFHHGGHGHVFVGGRIFIGAPFWWGPWYPYPYYASPPVVVQQTPPVYIQQDTPGQAATYWYYCEQAQGYYPYVKACPGGWLTVVPPAAPPAR